jgi:uncharacterized membrane protein YqhA
LLLTERIIENAIYASRWLLAPVYFGWSLALVGGLLWMVMSGSLKMKVAASIVAISSSHLLKVFMDATSIDDMKLVW